MQLFCISTKIQAAFWMAGKTCGICGKYDAEVEREYQTPSGYLAKDAASFGHFGSSQKTPVLEVLRF